MRFKVRKVFEVTTAASGKEALAVLEQTEVAVIGAGILLLAGHFLDNRVPVSRRGLNACS